MEKTKQFVRTAGIKRIIGNHSAFFKLKKMSVAGQNKLRNMRYDEMSIPSRRQLLQICRNLLHIPKIETARRLVKHINIPLAGNGNTLLLSSRKGYRMPLSNPREHLANVGFPAPLCPTTAMIAPSGILKRSKSSASSCEFLRLKKNFSKVRLLQVLNTVT
ncbi:hypothetical protein EHV15_33005 [Paenibacillus oralis]|uniref:Uncharacterized protein n=1 Tax=Paenibacillus oralis TaxID=2490856 RepID=A0A3P3UCE0_9BACL|nr:hypothetical protein [Paenibacillus oralis]RRJ67209.1 hypothetical protein EHV15_33005 [Paenibacillus oralis]